MGNQNKKFRQAAKLTNPFIDEADFERQFDETYDKRRYTKAALLAAAACGVFPDNWHYLYLYAEALYNDGHERWGTPELDVLEKIENACDLIIMAMEGRAEGLTAAPPEKDEGAYVLRAFALLGKGERLLSLKKPQEARNAYLDAEEQFMDVLGLWPEDLPSLTGYAEVLIRLGTADKPSGEHFLLARECFRKTIALDETHGQAYVTCSAGYAILLMRNNEDAEAFEVFSAALEHCPENALLLYGRDAASKRLNGNAESKLIHFNSFNETGDKKPGLRSIASNGLARDQISSRPPSRVDVPLRL